jgi:hypothetical protein
LPRSYCATTNDHDYYYDYDRYDDDYRTTATTTAAYRQHVRLLRLNSELYRANTGNLYADYCFGIANCT